MSFSCLCNAFILPRPLAQLVQSICCIRFAVATIFSYVGLQPPEIFLDLTDHEYHLSLSDFSTAPVSPAVAIKSKLPVVEFANLLKRSQGGLALRMSEEPKCMVCLGWLEAKDEVLELGNCCHTFHRECIHKWVDIGHVTCPLCRSQLLKSPVSWIQRVKFLWN